MGMGRNSSRVATRRLAKDSKDSYREGGHEEEDDDDDEWVEPGKKEMRRRRDKNSPRRNKSLKLKGDQYTDGTLTPPTSYSDLSLEERRSLLTSACGVTLSTNKICLRPTRCSAHSDHQRREVRRGYFFPDIFCKTYYLQIFLRCVSSGWGARWTRRWRRGTVTTTRWRSERV